LSRGGRRRIDVLSQQPQGHANFTDGSPPVTQIHHQAYENRPPTNGGRKMSNVGARDNYIPITVTHGDRGIQNDGL